MLGRYFPVGDACLGSIGDLEVIDRLRPAVAESSHDLVPVGNNGRFLVGGVFSGRPVGNRGFRHESRARRHDDLIALVAFIGENTVKICTVSVTLAVSGTDIRLELAEDPFGASQTMVFPRVLIDREKIVRGTSVRGFEIAEKWIFPSFRIVPFDRTFSVGTVYVVSEIPVVIVVRIKLEYGIDGLEVVQALYGFGAVPRLVQCRQQHPRQDRDDGNNNQEFYERKTALPRQ